MSLTSLDAYISLTRLLISQLQETVKKKRKEKGSGYGVAYGLWPSAGYGVAYGLVWPMA